MDSRCITRLALRNYKSIEHCDIELDPLTVLVGRNGVGKSNILDSLRFVADALRNTLEYAIRERGASIRFVGSRSAAGRPTPELRWKFSSPTASPPGTRSRSPQCRGVLFESIMSGATCMMPRGGRSIGSKWTKTLYGSLPKLTRPPRSMTGWCWWRPPACGSSDPCSTCSPA